MKTIRIEDKVNNGQRKKFLVEMARGRLPPQILKRRKYGFCNALRKIRK